MNVTLVGLSLVILSGCALAQPSASMPGHATVSPEDSAAFESDLHACRLKQPGRFNRRVRLPAEHQGVARCLRHRGWDTAGGRTQTSPPSNTQQSGSVRS